MMIYVSYYGCRRKDVLDKAFKVQISMNRPDGYEVNVNWRCVAPRWTGLLGPYKNGEIDDDEYARRYRSGYLGKYRNEIVREMNWIVANAHGHDVVMFCYCRPGAFCHRYLLQQFLNDNGFEVEELR